MQHRWTLWALKSPTTVILHPLSLSAIDENDQSWFTAKSVSSLCHVDQHKLLLHYNSTVTLKDTSIDNSLKDSTMSCKSGHQFQFQRIEQR